MSRKKENESLEKRQKKVIALCLYSCYATQEYKFKLTIMGKKAKKSFLARSPAWALSLLIFLASVGLFGLPLTESTIASIEVYININILLLIIYIIFIPAACFIICKAHPKSIWYAPFICNTWIIILLILFVKSKPELTFIIFLSACIILSAIGAFIGAKIGRRKINQVK